jgi:hypothetical protein
MGRTLCRAEAGVRDTAACAQPFGTGICLVGGVKKWFWGAKILDKMQQLKQQNIEYVLNDVYVMPVQCPCVCGCIPLHSYVGTIVDQVAGRLHSPDVHMWSTHVYTPHCWQQKHGGWGSRSSCLLADLLSKHGGWVGAIASSSRVAPFLHIKG